MGFFDRLKKMMGGGDDAAAEGAVETAEANAPPVRSKRKGERPPLAPPAAPTATLDDAFAARAEGKTAEARAIFRAIDRGAGLRTVLRAAAALEAKDDAELAEVLPQVRGEEPWRLDVQCAAALVDASEGARARASKLVDAAAGEGAPSWAIAWAKVAIGEDDDRRRALVDLLFADASLARTVAARDLKLEGAKEDGTAIARFASLDAGRVAIRKFGPAVVADLLDRARAEAR